MTGVRGRLLPVKYLLEHGVELKLVRQLEAVFGPSFPPGVVTPDEVIGWLVRLLPSARVLRLLREALERAAAHAVVRLEPTFGWARADQAFEAEEANQEAKRARFELTRLGEAGLIESGTVDDPRRRRAVDARGAFWAAVYHAAIAARDAGRPSAGSVPSSSHARKAFEWAIASADVALRPTERDRCIRRLVGEVCERLVISKASMERGS